MGLFLAGPPAVPASIVQAPLSEPSPIRGRSGVLEIVFSGDDAVAKLDQDDRDRLGGRDYAFPKERKEPLEDARHVRNAVARFNQVKGVSDEERDAAWKRIEAAARKFGVELEERSWRDLKPPPR
jgi:hypothetical protein